MKLPRDLTGLELASLLRQFGYETTRQTGSHLRLTSSQKGREHHVTVPAHRSLKVGTLATILTDVARYVEIDRNKLAEELFNR
ncbi:MAG: type II toxin-antitoxin system HicA family toxin [Acidobacteriia bacterium]|nr:type II toxin-antitoxin system HicA family toxin [Terriglobia bacterium]